jgi:hypothetical protein
LTVTSYSKVVSISLVKDEAESDSKDSNILLATLQENDDYVFEFRSNSERKIEMPVTIKIRQEIFATFSMETERILLISLRFVF